MLDEFLNLALAYESRETPSLQGFVAWLRTASAEIKRDMEIARDEVRVMTVHGAKGLEAPIVILADTTTEPQGPIQHQPRLLPLPAQDGARRTRRIGWCGCRPSGTTPRRPPPRAQRHGRRGGRRISPAALRRDDARRRPAGHLRLGRREAAAGRAAGTISCAEALKPHCSEEPADVGEGTVLRYRKTPSKPETLSLFDLSPAQPAAPRDLPDWLTHAVRARDCAARAALAVAAL